MRKRSIGGIAIVLIAAIVAYASDPWKDKDPASWDEKDVQKILQDSPWSHKVQMGASGGGAVPGTMTGTGGAAHPDMGPDNGRLANGGGTGIAGTTIAVPNGNLGPQTDFSISWVSSRTVREAQARRRELGGVSPNIARRDLAKPAEDYEVMVASSDMSVLAKEREEELKAHAALTLKNTKAIISPSRVVLQRGPTGRVSAIIFVFEKKAANGEPTFASDEKGADFVTQAGKTKLKVSFDFTKMKDRQGLDL
jgi:hypothetical protein